jgi:endoglucanase
MDAQMRSHSLSLVLFVAPLLTLACSSNPKDETWQIPPDAGTAPENSPVVIHGQLKVVGTQLQDQAGAPIQLKGVSSMWLNWESQPFAESKPALAYMRDNWKLSVIRSSMGTDASDGYLSDPVDMQARVEHVVQHAIELGVYVLVDWHTERAVTQQAKAVEFFRAMASKYGAYPNVIWEPYNEPTAYSWKQIKVYHQAVVAAIRAVDPDNLIVLGTPNYSQEVEQAALDPLAGTNLLYTLHFYSCTHQQSVRDKGNTAIAAGLPIFITEFGATYADGGLATTIPPHDYVCETEANLWFAWMAQNNISGVAWKLDHCTDASCILSANAPLDGPWTDDLLSTDAGGALSADGMGIQGGHGLFVVNWLRQ